MNVIKKVTAALLCATMLISGGAMALTANASEEPEPFVVTDKTIKSHNGCIKIKVQYFTGEQIINNDYKYSWIYWDGHVDNTDSGDTYDDDIDDIDDVDEESIDDDVDEGSISDPCNGYFDSRLINGMETKETIRMCFLQKFRFKPYYNKYYDYGNVVSCKVEMNDNDKVTELESSPAGYYTYDTSKPNLYKIKITYKTDLNNTVYAIYNIDNRKFLKKAWAVKDDGTTYGNLEYKVGNRVYNDFSGGYINYNYLAQTFRKFIIPEGSTFTYLKSSEFNANFEAAYYTSYNNYRKNGVSAKWTRLYSSTVLPAGEYTLMFRLKETNGVKLIYRNVITAPYVCVTKQTSVIDLNDTLNVLKKNGLIKKYTWDMNEEENDVFKTQYGYYASELYKSLVKNFDNLYVEDTKRYKSIINYKNMFNLNELLNYNTATDTDSKYKFNDITDDKYSTCYGFLSCGSTMMPAKNGVTELKISNIKIYYAMGKNMDYNKAKYYLVTNNSLRDIQNMRYENMGEEYAYYTLKVMYKVNGTWNTCIFRNVPVLAEQ